MTDEKMAEEYCNNEVPFDTTEIGEKLFTENDLKYAYLAGLKAGRTKWYKVADGDLPKEEKEYLIYMDDGTIDIQKICINGNGEYYLNGISWSFSDVIAWKEIPEPPKEIQKNEEKAK